MQESYLFPSVDASTLQRNLIELLRQTAQGRGRVEIRNDDDACVLVSKVELDALEEALAILSGTMDARQLHSQVRQFARQDAVQPVMGVEAGAGSH